MNPGPNLRSELPGGVSMFISAKYRFCTDLTDLRYTKTRHRESVFSVPASARTTQDKNGQWYRKKYFPFRYHCPQKPSEPCRDR